MPFYKATLSDVSKHLSNLAPHLLSSDLANLKQQEIEAGIPSVYPETSGKFLPHELNLPKLNAVSFEKGCYTGQEIIARMHYRGNPKAHLYRAIAETCDPPLLGADIYNANGEACGYVADYYAANIHYQLLMVCNDIDASTNRIHLDPQLTVKAHISEI